MRDIFRDFLKPVNSSTKLNATKWKEMETKSSDVIEQRLDDVETIIRMATLPAELRSSVNVGSEACTTDNLSSLGS